MARNNRTSRFMRRALALTSTHAQAHRGVSEIGPGLMLVVAIVCVSLSLRWLTGAVMISPLVLSVFVGMALRNLCRIPTAANAGIRFCSRTILRAGIVLFGFQINAALIVSVGWKGALVVVLSVVGTLLAGVWLTRLFRIEENLGQLIGVGTSICGASAIVAMSGVSKPSEEDVAYAVATVTIVGTLFMFAFPIVALLLGLDQRVFGIWAGASIHEVAQVAAASVQVGVVAGEVGIAVKLARVALLAPVLFILGRFSKDCPDSESHQPSKIPPFVIGFVLAMLASSILPIPLSVREWISFAATFALSMGLAALGAEIVLGRILSKGFRPLLYCLVLSVLLAGFTLSLVLALG